MGIKEAIASSGERGIQSFDIALRELYKQNRIALEEALITPTRARTSKRKSTSADRLPASAKPRRPQHAGSCDCGASQRAQGFGPSLKVIMGKTPETL